MQYRDPFRANEAAQGLAQLNQLTNPGPFSSIDDALHHFGVDFNETTGAKGLEENLRPLERVVTWADGGVFMFSSSQPAGEDFWRWQVSEWARDVAANNVFSGNVGSFAGPRNIIPTDFEDFSGAITETTDPVILVDSDWTDDDGVEHVGSGEMSKIGGATSAFLSSSNSLMKAMQVLVDGTRFDETEKNFYLVSFPPIPEHLQPLIEFEKSLLHGNYMSRIQRTMALEKHQNPYFGKTDIYEHEISDSEKAERSRNKVKLDMARDKVALRFNEILLNTPPESIFDEVAKLAGDDTEAAIGFQWLMVKHLRDFADCGSGYRYLPKNTFLALVMSRDWFDLFRDGPYSTKDETSGNGFGTTRELPFDDSERFVDKSFYQTHFLASTDFVTPRTVSAYIFADLHM